MYLVCTCVPQTPRKPRLVTCFQEFRHVRFRSGSTWFNDLSRCDKPLCLPPPSSAARDADTPPQHLSTVQPRVGAPEAARPPLSLGKYEMPKTAGNLLGCEMVGTSYVHPCGSRAQASKNHSSVASGVHSVQRKLTLQLHIKCPGSVGRAARNYATRGGDPITTRIASSCVAVSGLREPHFERRHSTRMQGKLRRSFAAD
ncbi:hypothetical protein K438DRAFT_1767643 [Mycena galopus ATCC 62051]|nr:hypothetical protein K438DRAFT_1767643 [Mycena galopus ATCC 62051]